ncbi:hypothetical protein [Qipengyuania spongiae]|uniref:Nuclear transport factor 2 family protein n=1 Tax=Qipengyuania spongiae TaxID=2909673 RepID=A0ABY5SYY1_9SPHN|nr:hypothetical protein [Qipengyuania spongiae]UVI38409.1 hypothetical protein L1F33_09055 [Qipengyuania spongiae]
MQRPGIEKLRLAGALAITCGSVLLPVSAPVVAQETGAISVEPNALNDGASVDAILAALYDVISGAAGEERDWDRFRALFHSDARLIATAIRANGTTAIRSMTPDDYIRGNDAALVGEGFFESEIARRTESFGAITHVWSTYEARQTSSQTQPVMRGINSLQLVNDGDRWWIAHLAWSAETPRAVLPSRYLSQEAD